VDLGHKSAFDLLLKEAWNPEQAAMGNSTLPTVSDKLNVMASIHNRKLIAVLAKELKEKDVEIDELKENIISLQDKLDDVYMEMEKLKKDKNQQQQQQQQLEP
jgi:septal ring factor EnvC (AmiA/AmiB activator)